MPTGFTAAVHDGEVTARQFLLVCARNFGAMVHQREEAFDAPLRPRTPSDYDQRRAEEARARLAELEAMTPEEADRRALAEFTEQTEQVQKYERDRDALAVRYRALIHQVETWTPPTDDHVELKEFALQQLRESLRFDCRGSHVTPPARLTGDRWRANAIEKARRDIDYHDEQHREELERCDRANRWLKQLQDGLPA